jgi:hypothetical protein
MALIAAVALMANTAAAAPAPSPSPAEDPKTTNDIRCVIVSASLSQSDDPDLQKLGTTSLLYFWGRLEGRGATTGVDARVVEEASKMTVGEMKDQAQTCAALVNAAGQGLQDLSAALKQRLGGGAPAP